MWFHKKRRTHFYRQLLDVHFRTFVSAVSAKMATRILLVDDDVDLVELLHDYLEREGLVACAELSSVAKITLPIRISNIVVIGW
ncbi:hypothetical protein CCP3SC15_5230003 [Gammaproteobacteria bacterium]